MEEMYSSHNVSFNHIPTMLDEIKVEVVWAWAF